MHKRDWALVAFTLLMQSAIGTLLVAAAASLAGVDGRAFDAPLVVAAWASVLALAASLLHLGRPARAWLALANVRSSWLSREIVASVVFVVALGIVAALRRSGGSALFPIVAVGVFVAYAMSRLYMVPAQPAWNRLLTPVAFFVSALLLGAVIVLATSALEPDLARRLAVVAIALAIGQGGLTSIYAAGLPAEPAAAISIGSIGSTVTWLTAARIGAAIAAIALLATMPMVPALTLTGGLAFACVIASELAGRVLFYAGGASIGPFGSTGR